MHDKAHSALANRACSARGRHILFLQGPPSPFFLMLGQALVARGHSVQKINFNLGDKVFWRRGESYRGSLGDWKGYLREKLSGEGVTDIVLFGDCRSYHRIAVDLANGMGVAVHVFEEGYLRPDWVTLERGGVNGFSTLPSSGPEIREVNADIPEPDPGVAVGHSLRNRVLCHTLYYTFCALGRFLYPFYSHHRPWPLIVESAGWVRRFSLWILERAKNRSALERLSKGDRGFFLFPLQLDSDFQIRVHSDFQDMEEALQVIISSFSSRADDQDQLVVKAHPLDSGLVNRRKQCQRIARRFGVEDRVVFIEGGRLSRLSREAKGLITVNSTCGMVALEQQRPVAVLGRAIYHMAGLTHQGSLDDFWETPQAPDADLLAGFIRLLKARVLINGSFFTDKGLHMGVETAVARIEEGSPGQVSHRQSRAASSPSKPEARAPMIAAE